MKLVHTLILLAAAGSLNACAIAEPGIDFTRSRIMDYCDRTSPEARDLLRGQLVHPDGSPMARIYCEPHGTPNVTIQPPDVDEGSPGWFGV